LINFILIFATLLSVVVGLNNGLGLTPPMGWTTWCTDTGLIPCYDDYCSEKEIMDVANSMVKNGLVELGYTYINLDDCWGGGRDANGNITADSKRFPSGNLKHLADFLHQRGMYLGVYTDAGPYTCRDSRPGSWPHYQQDAYTFANWGVDFVKMDWCGHPGQYDAEQLYGMMSTALNKTGRPIFFNACEWGLETPWIWGPKTANAWRIGPDHLPLWWTWETSQDPGQGQGTSNIIEHMAGLSSYAGPGGWNDPDFLMTGSTMIEFWLQETDWRTEFSFWALFAAPLIVATDVRELRNKQVLLNKEVIAVNQDPLGIAGDRYANYTNGGQIWAKPITGDKPKTKAWAVILYCANEFLGVDLTVKFAEHLPGWPTGHTTATVRDLWAHTDLGTFRGTFSASDIGPHAVVMVKITPS